jgi:hypothetical protein
MKRASNPAKLRLNRQTLRHIDGGFFDGTTSQFGSICEETCTSCNTCNAICTAQCELSFNISGTGRGGSDRGGVRGIL